MKYVAFITLLLFSGSSGALVPPEGWRLPRESDIVYEWRHSEDEMYFPHFKADFDGDGAPDDAWILFQKNGTGWGVFVFLNSDVVELRHFKGGAGGIAQLFNISVASAGYHNIFCTKKLIEEKVGYCAKEPIEKFDDGSKIVRLHLKQPGVIIRNNEYSHGGGMLYWLSDNKWKSVEYWPRN